MRLSPALASERRAEVVRGLIRYLEERIASMPKGMPQELKANDVAQLGRYRLELGRAELQAAELVHDALFKGVFDAARRVLGSTAAFDPPPVVESAPGARVGDPEVRSEYGSVLGLVDEENMSLVNGSHGVHAMNAGPQWTNFALARTDRIAATCRRGTRPGEAGTGEERTRRARHQGHGPKTWSRARDGRGRRCLHHRSRL